MTQLRRAPSLSGGDGWQQSGPRSISQLRGRVGVIWFYTLSCTACEAMVPGLRELNAREDTQVIGVHAPDFARDADPRRIGLHAAMAGMTWPILLDHRRRVFSRWQSGAAVQGWPRTYVIDRRGDILADISGAVMPAVIAATEQACGQPA